MSEQPQGPGWWLASDGRYYPPESAHLTPFATQATASWGAPDPATIAASLADAPSDSDIVGTRSGFPKWALVLLVVMTIALVAAGIWFFLLK